MFSMLGASALLPFLPMAPVQILFNNLLYDFRRPRSRPTTSTREYLAQPRRWDIEQHRPLHARASDRFSSHLRLRDVRRRWLGCSARSPTPALFQTGWFVESLLSQTLIVHVIRTGKIPFVESRPSRTLLWMTVAICGFGAWLPFSPLAGWLGLERLPLRYWPMLAAILVGYLTLTQLVKTWAIRRFRLE